jgi:hypothetical protein
VIRNTRQGTAAARMADDPTHEVGTLWTLERDDCTARCALRASPLARTWEVRVLVDGDTLLTERCGQQEVFTLAERWRSRMAERGWRKPIVSIRPRPDRRRPEPATGRRAN